MLRPIFYLTAPIHDLDFGRDTPSVWRVSPRTRIPLACESVTMFSLIPEQMFESVLQLACYGVAMLTVVVSFFVVPRA